MLHAAAARCHWREADIFADTLIFAMRYMLPLYTPCHITSLRQPCLSFHAAKALRDAAAATQRMFLGIHSADAAHAMIFAMPP